MTHHIQFIPTVSKILQKAIWQQEIHLATVLKDLEGCRFD
jgi:hypothetical protein